MASSTWPRQPQLSVLGCLAHAQQQREVLLAFHPLGIADLGLAGFDDLINERPDPLADVFEFGSEREVDGHCSHRRIRGRNHKSRATAAAPARIVI
jgi:hypothetical protein